jgi:hypothetical protein
VALWIPLLLVLETENVHAAALQAKKREKSNPSGGQVGEGDIALGPRALIEGGQFPGP